MASQPGPLFVGVDGGGTGCRARIEDAEGRVLGTGIAGPAALRLGIDRAVAEVEKASRAALDDAGLDSGALSAAHAAVPAFGSAVELRFPCGARAAGTLHDVPDAGFSDDPFLCDCLSPRRND